MNKKVTITVSGFSAEMLEELNEWAREERRDRSSQVVCVLDEAIQTRREKKAQRAKGGVMAKAA